MSELSPETVANLNTVLAVLGIAKAACIIGLAVLLYLTARDLGGLARISQDASRLRLASQTLARLGASRRKED